MEGCNAIRATRRHGLFGQLKTSSAAASFPNHRRGYGNVRPLRFVGQVFDMRPAVEGRSRDQLTLASTSSRGSLPERRDAWPA